MRLPIITSPDMCPMAPRRLPHHCLHALVDHPLLLYTFLPGCAQLAAAQCGCKTLLIAIAGQGGPRDDTVVLLVCFDPRVEAKRAGTAECTIVTLARIIFRPMCDRVMPMLAMLGAAGGIAGQPDPRADGMCAKGVEHVQFSA